MEESDDPKRPAERRAALLESRDPAAHAAVEAWEAAHPHTPKTGPFVSMREMMLQHAAPWVRFERTKLHDRVLPLRERVPPKPARPNQPWWRFWKIEERISPRVSPTPKNGTSRNEKQVMAAMATAAFREVISMSNHLKFCGCRRCRQGMHTKSGGKVVQRVIRKARRAAKQQLKLGQEPEPKQSVEYTD